VDNHLQEFSQGDILQYMNAKKSYNKNDIVTIGILEEILEEKLEQKLNEKLDQKLNERFAIQDESLSRMFGLVMEELSSIRLEMKQFRLEMQSVNASLLRHDREISGLDVRVLKLEGVG